MKAEELNTLVSLSCDKPHWELVKFSFEDSPEEAMNYYRSKEAGYPKDVYYNLDRDILILKAELQSNSDVFPRAVYYMRVDVGDVSDTDKLQKWWECNTEWLGKKLVEMVKGEIIVDINTSIGHTLYGVDGTTEYILLDITKHGGDLTFKCLLEGVYTDYSIYGNLRPSTPEDYMLDVVTDYLKGNLAEDHIYKY